MGKWGQTAQVWLTPPPRSTGIFLGWKLGYRSISSFLAAIVGSQCRNGCLEFSPTHGNFTMQRNNRYGFLVGDKSATVVLALVSPVHTCLDWAPQDIEGFSITSSHLCRLGSTGHCWPYIADRPHSGTSFELQINCNKPGTSNMALSPEDGCSPWAESYKGKEGKARCRVHICLPIHPLS